MTRIAECLAQIQNHVSVLLKMPAEITKDQALAIIEAATLLSGETQTGTVNGTINVVRHERRLSPNLDTIYEFIAIRSLKITLGSDEIPVGKCALFFRGRYLEIGDEEVTVEPLSEYVSGRYVGATHPAITQDASTDPGAPSDADDSVPEIT